MRRQAIESLREATRELGVRLPETVEQGFLRYQPLLERWNRRVRLVGDAHPAVVAVRHFADSLMMLPALDHVPGDGVVLDIGSGAGFPGIPLALAGPGLQVVLVEADGRKAAFLVHAAASLGLGGVRVERARAEGEPEEEGLPRGDLVVSRALMDPERWLPLGRAYLSSRGVLAAMMGGSALDEASAVGLGERYGLVLLGMWRGSLPGGEKRVVAAWRRKPQGG